VFFASHILGAAREPRLHPPLMRLLRRPREQIDCLLGDALTETVGKIIAGAFNGHAEDLFALARNPDSDEFLRATLILATAFLTWNRRIDPAETRAFVEWFDEARPVPAAPCGSGKKFKKCCLGKPLHLEAAA